MASSRRSRPADGAALGAAVERALGACGSTRLGVAYSGGRDSAALLHACALRAARYDVALVALHVHHGLSAHADHWVESCEALARTLRVPLDVRRVTPADVPSRGIEAAAREARYAALRSAAREHGLAAVALAQHEDDQAETLLLQALRGAGPHGLAGMAARSVDDAGLVWLRPLLGVSRRDVDDYVAAHALAFVNDDSNASPRHRRNALRHAVLPSLEALFPGATRTLARAARHQAEAASLLDDLAALDAQDAVVDGTLACEALRTLPPARARNLLRAFLRGHALPAPSAARLDAMLAQLAAPRADARVHLPHAHAVLGVRHGRIVVHAPSPPPYEQDWRGEATLALPHGALGFVRAAGDGLDAARLAGRRVVVTSRRGGERLAPHAQRPRRALAAWLYDAGIPAWQRDAWPLVFCDGELAAVPGVGVDVAWQASSGAPGYLLDWRPRTAA